MSKQNHNEAMVGVATAMPLVTTTNLADTFARIAAHRLPAFPPPPAPGAASGDRKSEAERAQRSKAALVHAARAAGVKGAAQMSREALARVLSH